MAFKSTVLMVVAAGFIAIAFAAPSENKKLEGKNEKLETAESFYYNGLGYPAYTGIHGYGGAGSYYYPSPYTHNVGYLNAGYPAYAYDGGYYNQHAYVGSPYYYGK